MLLLLAEVIFPAIQKTTFWIYTKGIRRLPRWVEWIFNTSSHHQVHHASDIKYLDRNHAGILITWDRLFGPAF